MRRLTAAIAKGGELATLVTALAAHERQRQDAQARLNALRTPRSTVDAAAVRQTLESYLRDWQGLLVGHVHQAQQVLRRLVVGRLIFTPQKGGHYSFSGTGTVRPLLGGLVPKLASPSGTDGVCTPISQ